MLGTILNCTAIVIGAVIGLRSHAAASETRQMSLKRFLGAAMVFLGLKLAWDSVGGSPRQVLVQIGMALLALSLGNLCGTLLGLQKAFNALGQLASRRFRALHLSPGSATARDSLVVGAAVFALAPLSIVGAAVEGTGGTWQVLGLKAAIDGFASIGFARVFGGTFVLGAIPVFVIQALVEWVARSTSQAWPGSMPWEALQAVAGLIVAASSLVILGLKRVPLASFLPALVIAPILAALWRR
jgi:uncharacterized membrane protein YqgA involved in biofilm formation